MSESNHTPPKLFISYAWTTPEHEEWVLKVARELRENGIDVVLDKWHLREGQNKYVFMEQIVSDPHVKKVLMVCDDNYVRKANQREGGAGVETSIISPQVYEKSDQTKFVAVALCQDQQGRIMLPVFYKSQIYIDMVNQAESEAIEQITRWVFDRPRHSPPPIGKPPEYINRNQGVSTGTSTRQRHAISLLRNGSQSWYGAVSEYVDCLNDRLKNLSLRSLGISTEEEIRRSFDLAMSSSVSVRNELLELATAICQYQPSRYPSEFMEKVLRSILRLCDPSDGINGVKDFEFDNFRFLLVECFLRFLSSLLERELFEEAFNLLQATYTTKEWFSDERVISFVGFQKDMRILMDRQGFQSTHIKIKDRCESEEVFSNLAQADFVGFVYSAFENLRENESDIWRPNLMQFQLRRGTPFALFLKCQSKRFLNRFAKVFGIAGKDDFEQLQMSLDASQVPYPSWHHRTFEFRKIVGIENFATRP
jgi:hypothetical protein